MSKFKNIIREQYTGWLPRQMDSLLDRFAYLVACGQLILPQYRFKWPQLDWWGNETFTTYLRGFDEHENMNTDRRWNLAQLMRLSALVPGDTVECGCYKGASSFLICESNRIQPQFRRIHHVFDSFEGLSHPGGFDGTHWSAHSLAASEEEFFAHMGKHCGEIVTYKGWIPERFPEVADREFAFVHIDVDLYEPTRDSIDFFYPRLNPGGVLVCDDYACTTCPGATKAIDDYLADKPEKMLAAASGGGFIIKGLSVGPAVI